MSPKFLVKEWQNQKEDRETKVMKWEMNAKKLLICMREKQHALAICYT